MEGERALQPTIDIAGQTLKTVFARQNEMQHKAAMEKGSIAEPRCRAGKDHELPKQRTHPYLSTFTHTEYLSYFASIHLSRGSDSFESSGLNCTL